MVMATQIELDEKDAVEFFGMHSHAKNYLADFDIQNKLWYTFLLNLFRMM